LDRVRKKDLRNTCIEACPFGMMQFNTEKGVAEKCHLCYHRIDQGERPACVDKCIGRCMYFDEIDEILTRLVDSRWKGDTREG